MTLEPIDEVEFLRTYYPSQVKKNGKPKFSIICRDPTQSIDSMILWPSLNFLSLTDNKVHFVYVGTDPSEEQPIVLDEIGRHFSKKSPSALLLFKKKAEGFLDFLGMFYVLSRTSDPKSIQRFRQINPNIKNGYELQSVLTLVEYRYLEPTFRT